MISNFNKPIIEIIEQGSIAVEEIKVGSLITDHENDLSINSYINSNKYKSNQQYNQQQLPIFLNTLHPYHIQQVLLQFEKAQNFTLLLHSVVKELPFNIVLKSNHYKQFNFNDYDIRAKFLLEGDPPNITNGFNENDEPLFHEITIYNGGKTVKVEINVDIPFNDYQDGSIFYLVLQITELNKTPNKIEKNRDILNNIHNNSILNLSNDDICVISHPIRFISSNEILNLKKNENEIHSKKKSFYKFHKEIKDKARRLSKSVSSKIISLKNDTDNNEIKF